MGSKKYYPFPDSAMGIVAGEDDEAYSNRIIKTVEEQVSAKCGRGQWKYACEAIREGF